MLLVTSILITAVLLVSVFLVKERWRNAKFKAISIKDIDKMNGHAFESYLELLFSNLGYQAKKTQGSGDFGVDLILKKDGKTIAVQIKRYRNKVNLKAVQEVVSGKFHYKADEAWVITNSYFTESAKKLAKSNHVQLIHRSQLKKLMNKAERGKKHEQKFSSN